MKSAIGANPIKKMLCLWDRTITNCWPLSDCAVFCKWIFLLLQCLRCWVKKKKIFCSYEIWSQFCWQSGNRRRRQCLSRFDDIDQFSFSVEDIMTFEGFSCFGEGRPDCGFQVWSYLVIIEFSIFFFVSDMVTHESSVNLYNSTGFNSVDYNLLVDLIFCSWKEISALSRGGREALKARKSTPLTEKSYAPQEVWAKDLDLNVTSSSWTLGFTSVSSVSVA